MHAKCIIQSASRADQAFDGSGLTASAQPRAEMGADLVDRYTLVVFLATKIGPIPPVGCSALLARLHRISGLLARRSWTLQNMSAAVRVALLGAAQ